MCEGEGWPVGEVEASGPASGCGREGDWKRDRERERERGREWV